MLWVGNGVIPISAAQVVVPPVSQVEVSSLSEPEARCIEWKEVWDDWCFNKSRMKTQGSLGKEAR